MRALPSRWTLLALLLVLLALVLLENRSRRPAQLYQLVNGNVEMCLACHREEKLDPAHAAEVLGCSSCHLGDPLAFAKDKAHQGIVRNPGDLRVVEKTCGVEGCHAQDVKKVKNSLMATNRGIIATLRYYWGEAETQDGDFSVEELLRSGETSLALDYFRKLCATCHLWKERHDMEGFFGEKGGGCTACHYSRPQEPQAVRPWESFVRFGFGTKIKQPHPLISKKVPMENCIRCHNRSGRVGTSYIGVYEDENYGTPYADGGLSPQILPGDRFYRQLSPDIHHQQGMACIDCHSRDEVMGDGERYAHYEQALEISCALCHNQAGPGRTRRDKELNNLAVDEEGRHVLVGKLTGKKHPLNPPKEEVCDYRGHRRLSCEACHSAWIPQCYGCHVKRDMRDTHLDKLTGKETQGWWEEGRSWLRFEKPVLAVWADRIVTVTPGCQDIVTLIDAEGNSESFNSLTMAALKPHTTRKESRPCADCHVDTKTMGLGEGTAWKESGQWRFRGVHQGVTTAAGTTPPLDAYVDIRGTPLQKSARPDLRPFNGQELARILRVGQCLPCHKEYSDPAFRDYTPERACPVFAEE
jgi:hypothetical protein